MVIMAKKWNVYRDDSNIWRTDLAGAGLEHVSRLTVSLEKKVARGDVQVSKEFYNTVFQLSVGQGMDNRNGFMFSS